MFIAFCNSIPRQKVKYPKTVKLARLIPAVQWTYVFLPNPSCNKLNALVISASRLDWSNRSKSLTETLKITTFRSKHRFRIGSQSISIASWHNSHCKQTMASTPASSINRSISPGDLGQEPISIEHSFNSCSDGCSIGTSVSRSKVMSSQCKVQLHLPSGGESPPLGARFPFNIKPALVDSWNLRS